MLDSPAINSSTTGPPAWLQYLGFNEYWQQSSEYKIQQILQLYIPPILIIFGSIGNVLAFVTLTRKHMKHSSVCYYMAMFAITNTIILYIITWNSFSFRNTLPWHWQNHHLRHTTPSAFICISCNQWFTT